MGLRRIFEKMGDDLNLPENKQPVDRGRRARFVFAAVATLILTSFAVVMSDKEGGVAENFVNAALDTAAIFGMFYLGGSVVDYSGRAIAMASFKKEGKADVQKEG